MPRREERVTGKNVVPETVQSVELEQLLALKFPNHRQQMLDCLLEPFKFVFENEDYELKLRLIKDLFLERKFMDIFKQDTLLPFYVVEYIPGRALCYRDLFLKIPELFRIVKDGLPILSLGGGNGAEVLGVGSLLALFEETRLNVDILDLSDFKAVPNIVEALSVQFSLQDRLKCKTIIQDLCQDELDLTLTLQNYELVTACFVLNEILTFSKLKFAKLVTNLVTNLPSGCLFLVVDSAGSFSETEIGSESTSKYMLFTLLDAVKKLEKVSSYDSVWYRFPSEMKYPRKLNNMRFFLRLYRKR